MSQDVEAIKYSKNFLSDVVFRLDYHPILVLRETLSPQFHEAVRGHMPLLQEQRGFEYHAEIKEGSPETSAKPVASWILMDKLERFKLTVNYSFLAIEDLHYTTLDDYLDRIRLVIQAFTAAYEKPEFTRVGLRYINTIDLPQGDPLDWSDYVEDTLVCSLNALGANKSYLSRAMGQYVLNKDEYQVVCNYGLFNPEYPSRISRRQYILDYDCFSPDVSKEIPDQVRSFNHAVLELFETSIRDSLRKIMGGKHAGAD